MVFGPMKWPVPMTQFRAAVLEIGEVHVDEAVDHFAFALAHAGHVDPPIVLGDAEFLAAAKIIRHLGAVDDVLARQTGDVGAGTADIFPLNHRHARALFGQRPGDVFAGFAAAEHQDVKSLRFFR